MPKFQTPTEKGPFQEESSLPIMICSRAMLNLFGYIYLERQNVPQTMASKKT